MHNWLDGIKRTPLHLATFGVLGALATFYGGWGAAAVLLAWRGYAEYLDWHNKLDSFGKAWIDLASQTIPAIVTALIKI